MKMARCITELERIYGIRQGSAGGNGSNQYINKELDLNNSNEAINKTQKQLAEQIGIDQSQLINYKKLNDLIPELQSLVETATQKAEEGKLWEEIEGVKAKQRMLSGGYPMDNVPQGTINEKGAVRDIIAARVGLGSGRTYARAKTVTDKIDKNRIKLVNNAKYRIYNFYLGE